jgi:predicted Zn-dependent peptidase
VQSIRQITPDLLYRCHRSFYHPANMLFVVAGGFDAQRCAALAEKTMEELAIGPGRAYVRPAIDEPATVRRRRVEQDFAVSRPQLALGFKDLLLPKSPEEFLRRDLETRLLLDVLFSTSSPYHQRLYESGLIDDSFDASYSGEDDFGFTILGAETDDPDRLVAELWKTLAQVRKEGIARDDFELARRRFLGRYVRAFNSAEALAGALVTCHFRRIRLDDLTRIAMELAPADLERRLAAHLGEEHAAVSILRPNAAAAKK